MKKYAVCLVCLFFCIGILNAQFSLPTFSRTRPLYSFQTEHFTFIFPKESQVAAERLAGMAESVYDEVAGKLQVKKNLHIPVVITPDSEQMNGQCIMITNLHMILYQAPVSPNNDSFMADDVQRLLFLHELTHAVSLMQRDPFWEFLGKLFTDMIAPVVIIAPGNFVEGVTVSFESADGLHGRASHTAYAAYIQQDIIEGKFKTFAEAAGSWKEYPWSNIYIYGGYFSKFLQETYGMERYAALWKAMGSGNFITGVEGFLWFKGFFEQVYKIKIDEAWNAFKQYMSIKVPIVTAVEPVTREYNYFLNVYSKGTKVYWSDITSVKLYDSEMENIKTVFDYDSSIERLSVTPDGERMLISASKNVKRLAKRVLREYSIKHKKWLPTRFPDKLLEAAYMPDGQRIIATRIAGHTLDLVMIQDNTVTELFHGTEQMIPSMPYAFGDNSVVFIMQYKGENKLARLNLDTKKIELLETSEQVGRIHYLFSDGERLCFAYDTDSTLFKLAVFENGQLSIQTIPLSGGIQFPVFAGERIYYAGYFSEGHLILKYPGNNPALSLQAVGTTWKELPQEDIQKPSAYDDEPSLQVSRYSALPWLLLPQTRYPLLSFNIAASPEELLIPTGAGIGLYGEDPSQEQALGTSFLYKWNDRFLEASMTYINRQLPFDLTCGASETLSTYVNPADVALGDSMRHSVSISLLSAQEIVLEPAMHRFFWQLMSGLDMSATGQGIRGTALSDPYTWPFDTIAVPFWVNIGYSVSSGNPFIDQTSKAFSLQLGYYGFEDIYNPGLPLGYARGAIAVSHPFFNFSLMLNAIVSAHNDVSLGCYGPVSSGINGFSINLNYPEYKEFSGLISLLSPFYSYGDAGIGYTFPTHTSIRYTGVYVQSFFIRAGYRAAYLGSLDYLHSLYTIIGCTANGEKGYVLSMYPVKIGVEIDGLLNSPVFTTPQGIQITVSPYFQIAL